MYNLVIIINDTIKLLQIIYIYKWRCHHTKYAPQMQSLFSDAAGAQNKQYSSHWVCRVLRTLCRILESECTYTIRLGHQQKVIQLTADWLRHLLKCICRRVSRRNGPRSVLTWTYSRAESSLNQSRSSYQLSSPRPQPSQQTDKCHTLRPICPAVITVWPPWISPYQSIYRCIDHKQLPFFSYTTTLRKGVRNSRLPFRSVKQ